MPNAEEDFFQYISTLSAQEIEVSAIEKESFVFPREPLIRLEGPIAIVQLI